MSLHDCILGQCQRYKCILVIMQHSKREFESWLNKVTLCIFAMITFSTLPYGDMFKLHNHDFSVHKAPEVLIPTLVCEYWIKMWEAVVVNPTVTSTVSYKTTKFDSKAIQGNYSPKWTVPWWCPFFLWIMGHCQSRRFRQAVSPDRSDMMACVWMTAVVYQSRLQTSMKH